jgi:hypothetical protein
MKMEFIKSQAFAVDGVEYSIGVYRTDQGYVAFCDCHACQNHNMRSKPSPGPEAAIKECEELISGHHGECHIEGWQLGVTYTPNQMTPAHDELCRALTAVGSETCAMHDVRIETLHRLAALDLVRHEPGGWTLTNAGSKLLLRLVDGEDIEPLA